MKKYGRTFHLPISPGATSDEKIMPSTEGLQAGELVITEKMDGENTTIHSGGTHARSPDSGYHASRDWMKAFAAGIAPMLAANERIVGEYLFARHSVAYSELPSYFLGFAWVVEGVFQDWDATLDRFAALGISPVPELYRGPYSDGLFEDMAASLDLERQEGFVVRTVSAFSEADMPRRLGKYVREDHVQSEVHWTKMEIVRNGLG
jgi:hypothetical protein